MSLETVMKQVKAIGNSTGTKHPKTLIAELCGVIQALVLEIEKIQQPKMTVLKTEDDSPQTGPYPPYNPSRINAGDAE